MKSFQNLLTVAKQPTMSIYVKSVTYNAVLLQPVDTDSFGDDAYKKLVLNCLNSKPAHYRPDSRFHDAMSAYQQYLQRHIPDQASMLWTKYDCSSINAAFSRFDNLKHVKLSTIPNDSSYIVQDGFRLRPQAFTDTCDAGCVSSSTRSFFALHGPLLFLQNLNSLALSLENWSLFKTQNRLQVNAICQMFSRLKTIELNFTHFVSISLDVENQQQRSKTLGMALRAAGSLESLSLVYGLLAVTSGQIKTLHARVLLTAILDSAHWKHLRKFTLRQATIHDSFDLFRFRAATFKDFAVFVAGVRRSERRLRQNFGGYEIGVPQTENRH